MSSSSAALAERPNASLSKNFQQSQQFVTMRVDNQLLGIAVLTVRDVLHPERITSVPLAPPEVVGALNLRGRIVTAIDLRTRLGMTPHPNYQNSMCVVVSYQEELYSILVDSVDEVMTVPFDQYEKNPPNLDACWHQVMSGVCRLKDELLIILDIERLFGNANDL